MIPVSERFLVLLRHQLDQFADCRDLRSLVVYVTHQGEDGHPTLMPVGQWPADDRSLPALDSSSRLRVPAEERRWLPLRDEQVLLGALQVETAIAPWPEPLAQRLQAVALGLTEALRLDLERQQVRRKLEEREEQLRLLVHQLRNPLAALRTFGQLLLRRLGPDSQSRTLVEGMLAEERQLLRYVDAISDLARPDGLLVASPSPQPLLLPPLLSGPGGKAWPDPSSPCCSAPRPRLRCRVVPGTVPGPCPNGGATAAWWPRSWPTCSRTPFATAPTAVPWGCTVPRATTAWSSPSGIKARRSHRPSGSGSSNRASAASGAVICPVLAWGWPWPGTWRGDWGGIWSW